MDLRKLDLPGAKVLGRYNYSSPHHPLPRHRHPGMIEICYLHRGRQTYQVGEDTFMLRGGEFFVTFPGEWHSTGPDPEARGVLYWLILELSPLPDAFLGQAGKTGGQLARQLGGLVRRHFPAPRSTKNRLEQLLKLRGVSCSGLDTLSARAILLEFLLSVIRSSNRQLERENPSWLPKVLDYIGKSLADSPQVPDLAEVAGLSVSRFKIRFRELTGMAPAEYVLQQRIAAAQQLLADSGKSITEIAYELGFSSSQTFATAFRRITSLRPSDVSMDHRRHRRRYM